MSLKFVKHLDIIEANNIQQQDKLIYGNIYFYDAYKKGSLRKSRFHIPNIMYRHTLNFNK